MELNFLYIQSNKDWKYENKFKFGFTTNPNIRLQNNNNQLIKIKKP